MSADDTNARAAAVMRTKMGTIPKAKRQAMARHAAATRRGPPDWYIRPDGTKPEPRK